MRRRLLIALCASALCAAGASSCPSGGTQGAKRVQELVAGPGYVEPHTPGSGAPEEMATPAIVTALLGLDPDLNRVHTLRTRIDQPGAPPPRVVVILVPGFLGGAATFGPLARQIVERMNGTAEVWAVDRRPNQLEDARGAEYALANVPGPNDFATFLTISDGVAYYFQNPSTPNPFLLPDALGNPGPYRELAQDDLRYAAHWGVDTYARDWRLLVDEARALVGEDGLVLFGGHSQGTSWAGIYAAYDFDPTPGVDAGYEGIDGLLLLEGGGPGPGSDSVSLSTGSVPRPADASGYAAIVSQLAVPGGPDVFLESANGIRPADLGPGAMMAGIAADQLGPFFSILQTTPLFGTFPFNIFYFAPLTNRALLAAFVDDDIQPFTAFRASVGFSDDGPNIFQGPLPGAGVLDDIYVLDEPDPPADRTWKDHDDPTLPSCPPNLVEESPGCAIRDHGPKPPAGEIGLWGVEREVTDVDDLIELQFTGGNFVEWYFLSGRVSLDLAYGRDASTVGDETLLATTRNASVDVPVLAIGGSNGLAPTEASFADYLSSIATPPAQQEVELIEGYAHLDVLTAADNDAVPLVVDWIGRLLQAKLLASF